MALPKNVVRVRNQAQQVLLRDELLGQISDGMWENTPGTGWEQWCNADVVVEPTMVGRNFYARKDNFNLASKALLDVVGDRMLDSVRALGGDYERYSMADMKADLVDLKAIFRTFVSPTDADKAKGQAEAEAQELARRQAEARRQAVADRVKELTGGYVSRGQYSQNSVSTDTLEKLLALIPAKEEALA